MLDEGLQIFNQRLLPAMQFLECLILIGDLTLVRQQMLCLRSLKTTLLVLAVRVEITFPHAYSRLTF